MEYISLGGKVIAQRGKATANGCTKWLLCESFEGGGISGDATSDNVTYLHNDILSKRLGIDSKKGKGFVQPTKTHSQWHTDISYVNIEGTYFYLISVLDVYSRAILS